MEIQNYNEFRNAMILRDHLALDRTILANERTLLAYLRTFIGAFSAGVGMVKLLGAGWTTYIGYAFMIISPVFIWLGISRTIKMHKKLHVLHEPAEGCAQEE